MNIILGASGQVGSSVVRELVKQSMPVRAIVRRDNLVFDRQVEVRTADFFNQTQLKDAFKGGTTVFLLTPENPASNDIIGETRQLIENYKEAVRATGIKRIIGLSSVGAHVRENTGNLLMSRILENGFDDIAVEKIFIRPSYYYSNWLGFRETMEQHNILPTFFPEELKIYMNSPFDVAKFISEIIKDNFQSEDKKIIELIGPKNYNALDVAQAFSKLLNKNIKAETIPKSQWASTLLSAGFTENTAANLMDMTQTVIDNIAIPEHADQAVKLTTSLEQYLTEKLSS